MSITLPLPVPAQQACSRSLVYILYRHSTILVVLPRHEHNVVAAVHVEMVAVIVVVVIIIIHHVEFLEPTYHRSYNPH